MFQRHYFISKLIKSQRQLFNPKNLKLESNTQIEKSTTAKSALNPDVLTVITLH